MDWKRKRQAVAQRLADSTTDVGEYLGLLIEEDMEHMPPGRAPLEVTPGWGPEMRPTSSGGKVATRTAGGPKHSEFGTKKKRDQTEEAEEKASPRQRRSGRDPRLKKTVQSKKERNKRLHPGKTKPVPATGGDHPGNGQKRCYTPTEEEMMTWSIKHLKEYLTRANQHAYGLRITLVRRLRRFFIQNPEKMRQFMETEDRQGAHSEPATTPARETPEEQSNQEPSELRHVGSRHACSEQGCSWHAERENGKPTKAAEGLRQREKRQRYWEDKLQRYMEYLLNNDDSEAWTTDAHWLRLPIKVKEARRATKEYERSLKRVGNTDNPEMADGKPEILECGRCGTVFIEGEDIRDNLEAHKISHCAEFTLLRIHTFWEDRNKAQK